MHIENRLHFLRINFQHYILSSLLLISSKFIFLTFFRYSSFLFTTFFHVAILIYCIQIITLLHSLENFSEPIPFSNHPKYIEKSLSNIFSTAHIPLKKLEARQWIIMQHIPQFTKQFTEKGTAQGFSVYWWFLNVISKEKHIGLVVETLDVKTFIHISIRYDNGKHYNGCMVVVVMAEMVWSDSVLFKLLKPFPQTKAHRKKKKTQNLRVHWTETSLEVGEIERLIFYPPQPSSLPTPSPGKLWVTSEWFPGAELNNDWFNWLQAIWNILT